MHMLDIEPGAPAAVLDAQEEAGSLATSGAAICRDAPVESARGEECDTPEITASDVLLTGLWMAVATGLIESGYWIIKQSLMGEMTFLPGGFAWMSPVTQLLIFAIPTLPLAAAVRYAGWPRRLQPVVAVLGSLAWLNLLLLGPPLNLFAYVLLASGLGVATGRLLPRRPTRNRSMIVWSLAGMGILMLGAAAFNGVNGRHQHPIAPLPSNARPEGPDVLLLVLDTVRIDALDAMPNLAHFATRGVVFDNAQSTSPWTLPSHGSMFTSRLPHELSGDWITRLDDRYPTLAEVLSRAGYATAGFVANTRYCSQETGLDRGFDHYQDYLYGPGDYAITTAIGRKTLLGPLPPMLGYYDWPGRKSAAVINNEFLDWHVNRPNRPYFAFLNYWDAHDPYMAPPPFGSTQSATRAARNVLRNWWWMDKKELDDEQVAWVRSANEECLRYLDFMVGKLLDELQHRGALANTVVIIASDHGEHFGEQDLFSHGNSLYQSLLHVPLIVVWPGHIPAGRHVAEPVSLSELPATITALVDLDHGPFLGRPLSQLWDDRPVDTTSQSVPVISEIGSQAKFPPCHGRSPVARGEMTSVRDGPFKYIHDGDGEEELYNLESDPGEKWNLAGEKTWQTILIQLRNIAKQRSVGLEESPPARGR